MSKLKSKCKFFLTLLRELLLLPLLYVKYSKGVKIVNTRIREPIKTNTIYIDIHEWAGYPQCRKKTLKNGRAFECGLMYQLQRFESERKQVQYNYNIDLTVTISDAKKYNYDIAKLKTLCDHVLEVSNEGLDFSGYAAFYDSIKEYSNSYVLLTNSSVNSLITPFLYDYIKYMENNPDVGILGISYSTKMYQTLIKNNFKPHVQSFFLLTTLDVLREIVSKNKQKFPGVQISDKRLLIREGEIKISQLALALGYNLAIVHPETGTPFKFVSKEDWKLPLGDLRLSIESPNMIAPLNTQYINKDHNNDLSL